MVILKNVTLGAGSFELDKIVLRGKGQDKGLSEGSESSAQAELSKQLGEGGAPQQKPGREQEPEPEPEPEEVEVLAIVEEKVNVNDIGTAFGHFQTTIAWLTGDKDGYSPQDHRNRCDTATGIGLTLGKKSSPKIASHSKTLCRKSQKIQISTCSPKDWPAP